MTDDKNEGKTPDIAEGKTGKWFTGALKKAGTGVVKAGVDVAASVITQAIKHYGGG